MTAADGTVHGHTKLVDHGPDSARWTMVILSEGYQEDELPTFHTDADAFVNKLFATQPFTDMWCAINVYRVDVSSTDSGADDPAACGDGTAGSGKVAATFFDATFCVNSTKRLLAGNSARALLTAQTEVPEADATVVIVNDPQYGGAGGAVAWFSTDPRASEIGIHELGHSAFRLMDEYSDAMDTWTGGEPVQPNITADTDRATTKWADLIDPATPVPTQTNPDCTTTNTAPSPVAAGTVGLFEGGGRARCGLHRPEYDCYMRNLGVAFCAVCSRAIRTVLAPHLPAFSGPQLGTQFTGAVAAKATNRWFTYDWPACWHVVWTVTTASPVTPGPGITWDVHVERASRERVTYWIAVSNLTDGPVDVAGRYAIVAKG
jgi:hypothetical protein